MYKVKEGCPGCGACLRVCPVQAITRGSGLAVEIGKDCVDCGVCAGACPVGLIEKAAPRDETRPARKLKGGSTDAQTSPGI